jgi:hypothetical protein
MLQYPQQFSFKRRPQCRFTDWHKAVLRTTTVLNVELFPLFYLKSHPALLPVAIAYRCSSSPVPPTKSCEANSAPIYCPTLIILKSLYILKRAHGGTVALGHCATSRKVAASIPVGVIGIFH